MEIRTRDYKLDALKMFLMVSVIFGHIPLLDGFLDLYLPNEYDFLTMQTMKGIYAFHMPLFVLISGYFTKKQPLATQFKKSLRLLRLFIIFQIIDIFIRYIFIQEVLTLGHCLYPCFALWYLLCLFYWRMLVSIIPQKLNPKWIIAISFLISIAVGFTKINGFMGLHRFFSFMPYFMIGHYYGKSLLQFIENKYITILSFVYTNISTYLWKILVIFSFFVLMGLASLNPHWLDCMIQPYESLKVLIIRIAYLCYSLLLCYFLVYIFNLKHNWNKNTLSKFGRDTLFFYLLHPYILYVMTILIGGAEETVNIFDSILITAFTVAVLVFMEKVKVIHLLIK